MSVTYRAFGSNEVLSNYYETNSQSPNFLNQVIDATSTGTRITSSFVFEGQNVVLDITGVFPDAPSSYPTISAMLAQNAACTITSLTLYLSGTQMNQYDFSTPTSLSTMLTALQRTSLSNLQQVYSGDDAFYGSTQLNSDGDNDNVFGYAGNDTFYGYVSSGMSQGMSQGFEGGAGQDTAVFRGARAEYTVAAMNTSIMSTSGAGYMVTDAQTSRDGATRLLEVERARFSDVTVALDMGTSQSGGQTALLIGSVLGRTLAFANDAIKQTVLGNVVALFDNPAYNMQTLAGALMRLNHDSLDIWTTLAGGNDLAHIARYVLTTTTGNAPTQTAVDAAVVTLTQEASSALTQGTWLASQATSYANQVQINLVGLQTEGMIFR